MLRVDVIDAQCATTQFFWAGQRTLGDPKNARGRGRRLQAFRSCMPNFSRGVGPLSFAREPFLKWAGGKRRLVPFIAETLELVTDKTTAELFDSAVANGARVKKLKRLIEPFAGSAAFSLALADRFDEIWLNDVNADVINVYATLRRSPAEYVRATRELFRDETNNPDTYYELRDEFNRTASSQRRAVLFLYLNRHGYNGLCRYNNVGRFNVPFGRYKKPYFPEAELRAAARVLVRAKLTTLDFEKVLRQAGPGDLVYCDPPYVPLSRTASFTDYASGGFGPEEQVRLARAAEEAARRGALVAISNHDTEWTRELYIGAELYSVPVRRSISANGQARGEVRELLALYRPEDK